MQTSTESGNPISTNTAIDRLLELVVELKVDLDGFVDRILVGLSVFTTEEMVTFQRKG